MAKDSYSLDSTFTLQDRVEAIEQSSEEFYEEVSKRSKMYEAKYVLRLGKNSVLVAFLN